VVAQVYVTSSVINFLDANISITELTSVDAVASHFLVENLADIVLPPTAGPSMRAAQQILNGFYGLLLSFF
jgi:hypothetical protein